MKDRRRDIERFYRYLTTHPDPMLPRALKTGDNANFIACVTESFSLTPKTAQRVIRDYLDWCQQHKAEARERHPVAQPIQSKVDARMLRSIVASAHRFTASK